MQSKSTHLYAKLFFMCLLAHGFLLLNNGSYNDGLLYTYWQQTDLSIFRADRNEVGVPLYYYYQTAFAHFPDLVFANKAATLIGILIIAFSSFTLLKNHTPLSPEEALTITLISSLWPFYPVATSISILPYIIDLAEFYTGWLIYLQAKHGYGRIAAMALITASFFNNELMIYHGALMFLYFLWEYRKRGIVFFIRKNLLLCVAPIGFYIAKTIFLQPYGSHDGYNKLIFAYGASFFKTIAFFFYFLFYSIVDELQPLEAAGLYLVLFFPVPILIAGYFYVKRRAPYEAATSRKPILIAGLILLIASVSGYVLAAKFPNMLTYEARHGLVGSLGAALLIYGVFNLNKHKLISALLIAGLTLTDIAFYLSWQARWAQDEAFMQQMKDIPPMDNVSLFFLANGVNAGVDPLYQTSDATILTAMAWGDEKWGVVPNFYAWFYNLDARGAAALFLKNNAATPDMARRNVLSHFNPKGCWAELMIMPVGRPYQKLHGFPNFDEMSAGIEYTYDRFFRPQRMHEFLDGLLKVTIHPVHTNSEGTNC